MAIPILREAGIGKICAAFYTGVLSAAGKVEVQYIQLHRPHCVIGQKAAAPVGQMK